MWSFFITHSRFSYLLIIALLGIGIFSITQIPKESAPEVEIPVALITTTLPGSSASDVEMLITNEIERSLDGALNDVKTITSTSRESISSITIEYTPDADIDDAIQKLREEVDKVVPNLPTNANDPQVSKLDFVDQPVYSFAVAGNRPETVFIDIANTIEDSLQSIDNVSRISSTGVREPTIHVLLDPARLSQYNVSTNEVVRSLQQANTSIPIGEIVSDKVAYNLIFTSNITNEDDIGNIPVTNRGGQTVFLRDLGTVNEGVSLNNTFSRLSVTGEPAQASIAFNVYKQPGGDITKTTESISETLKELKNENPSLNDLTFHTIYDAGADINDSLTELTTSGLQTALLVTILLVIALGWREGVIAGTAIPLSFTVGFIGLWLSGNTINFISLFALILSIGILVDSSIVVIEGINKKMKRNPDIDKTKAAIETIFEYKNPVIAGTLTTVAMFSGLFVVSGITGEFIASIPFTVIFVLLASLLVALGFIPLFASTILKRRSRTKVEQLQVDYANRLESWYSTNLSNFLANTKQKKIFITILLVGFISSFLLIPLGLVQVVFFGGGDADTLYLEASLPAGSISDTTDQTVRAIEEILYDIPEIKAFQSTIGTGNVFLGNSVSGGNIANINITLEEDRSRSSAVVADELRERTKSFSNIDITITQPDAGPPTGSPIGINVLGTDLANITTTSQLIAGLLNDIPGTANIDDGTSSSNSEFVLQINKGIAAKYGLNNQDVANTLRNAVTGTEATSITTLENDMPVYVRLQLRSDADDINKLNHVDLSTLESLQINTPTGEKVILGSLLTSELRAAQTSIEHRDLERVNTVTADIIEGGNVRVINTELLKRLDSIQLPDDITIQVAGETEESNQAFLELFLALIVGITLMVGVLVLQFDSYRYPAYVLSIVPFSLIGILYGLAIVGSPLSFPSIMGFIALTGIVVNNSILLIDMINTHRKEFPEQTITETVVLASTSRLRPVLLTTITTVLGITPLLFTDPIWVPLATAIMFGLSFSVIITLIFIPLLYDTYPGKLKN